MPPALGHSQRTGSSPTGEFSVAELVLLRIAAGGAARVDLQRDLAPLWAPQMPGTDFRRAAELAIASLAQSQLATEQRGRLTATSRGLQVASSLVDARNAVGSWKETTTALSMRALGAPDTPANRKSLERAEGIAALALQKHFKLPVTRALSLADLRAALAIIALERAFGNKIKTGLGKSSGLPAKAGRLLGGQLFRQPREFASDGKLIMALAAETLGCRDISAEALELALLRNLLQGKPSKAIAPAPIGPVRATRTAPPRPANDRTPLAPSIAPTPPTFVPPDMPEFTTAVLDAARPVSEGWPGNRKAFISLVWKAIRHSRPDWGLSEIAFKGMLAEAHRSGRLELATADLKDGRDRQSLDESRILYKNTVWHFVRVHD